METGKFTYDYPHPAVTTDCVVFGYDGQDLHILLVERGVEPFKGSWALPGGFVRPDESLEQCARHELKEETNITCSDVHLEQFQVFSDPHRDPRERVITVAFFALINSDAYRIWGDSDAADARWFPHEELPPLAFDHDEIIAAAQKHLRERVRTRPIVFQLLGNQFSMPQLQRLYEVITGATYDRRNFARKALASGLIVENNDDSNEQPGIIESISCKMADDSTHHASRGILQFCDNFYSDIDGELGMSANFQCFASPMSLDSKNFNILAKKSSDKDVVEVQHHKDSEPAKTPKIKTTAKTSRSRKLYRFLDKSNAGSASDSNGESQDTATPPDFNF